MGCVEREDKCEIEGIERDRLGWERNEMDGLDRVGCNGRCIGRGMGCIGDESGDESGNVWWDILEMVGMVGGCVC